MTGWAAGGVEVPSRSRSVIRRSPTMACWYPSKTWESCWMGAKTMSMYSR